MAYHQGCIPTNLVCTQELAQAELHFRKALDNQTKNPKVIMQKLGLVLYRQGKLPVGKTKDYSSFHYPVRLVI